MRRMLILLSILILGGCTQVKAESRYTAFSSSDIFKTTVKSTKAFNKTTLKGNKSIKSRKSTTQSNKQLKESITQKISALNKETSRLKKEMSSKLKLLQAELESSEADYSEKLKIYNEAVAQYNKYPDSDTLRISVDNAYLDLCNANNLTNSIKAEIEETSNYYNNLIDSKTKEVEDLKRQLDTL